MRTPLRDEVYMVDLGLAAKVAPTSRFEVAVPLRFLRPGAFDAQGIVTVPTVRLMNRLGTLTSDQVRSVEKGVCAWLGIKVKT